jgi:hypothetical protein
MGFLLFCFPGSKASVEEVSNIGEKLQKVVVLAIACTEKVVNDAQLSTRLSKRGTNTPQLP